MMYYKERFNYKFSVVEYETNLKQLILNTIYFETAQEVYTYLGITKHQYYHWKLGRFALNNNSTHNHPRRDNLLFLNKIDVFRKDNNFAKHKKNIDNYFNLSNEDFIEFLITAKTHLRKTQLASGRRVS